jgi:replicative DNA helicase
MHNALQARDSERVVLGSLLTDGMAAMEQCLRLHAQMFYLPAHQVLFRELQRLAGDGRDWNEVSIGEVLQERKLFADVTGSNGVAYLHDLANATPYQRFNPSEHVARICEAWKRREGASLCERYGKELQEGEAAEATLAKLQQAVFDVIAESQEQDDPLVIHHSWREYEAFIEAATNPEMARGFSYGNAKLDSWTNGMQSGEVTVVGARSGVGKSALMCQAMAANCRTGIPVESFSLEMTRARVLRRLWAIESGVEYRKVHRPQLASVAERQGVKEAALRVAEWPLRIHENAAMPIDEIVARARMSVRRYGTKIVCVDYLQIVEGPGKDDRTRVAAASSKLRKLAKDEGCHVMILSQLRKVPVEKYSDPPTAGDLRETGQIENDAHVIVLLHRPWDNDRLEISMQASLLVPKCRDGKTGAMVSKFDERSLTFAAL